MLSGGFSNRTAMIRGKRSSVENTTLQLLARQTARHDRRGAKGQNEKRTAGQDSVNNGMKLIRSPERRESHSARRGGGIAPYPLNQQGSKL